MAQQPSGPQRCEPRRSFICLMSRQTTEPSRCPIFPPTAPRVQPPLLAGLLPAFPPAPRLTAVRGCGTLAGDTCIRLLFNLVLSRFIGMA